MLGRNWLDTTETLRFRGFLSDNTVDTMPLSRLCNSCVIVLGKRQKLVDVRRLAKRCSLVLS